MPNISIRDLRFPFSDRARVLKLIIASYIGFLLVALLGFRATSSISVSAIMTLPYGTTITNTRQYARKRFLAQLIGVAVTYPLYLFFLWAEFVPPSQRLALPMTLSLIITAWINRRFKLNIPDITMLIPGYLVLLMTPSYHLYPVMRPIYVLLGILIGYALNVWIFAPDYGKLVQGCLASSGECLQQIMDGYDGQSFSEEKRALLDQAESDIRDAASYLPQLRVDLARRKKYQCYLLKIDFFERRLKVDGAAAAALHALAQAAPPSAEVQRYCIELFSRHRCLCQAQSAEGPAAECGCPLPECPEDIIVVARLLELERELTDTSSPIVAFRQPA